MRMHSILNLAASCALALGAAGVSVGQDGAPPIGQKLQMDLQQWAMGEQTAGREVTRETYMAKAAEMLATLDYTTMSAADISSLANVLTAANEETQAEAAERLEALAADKGPDGAVAAAAQLMMVAPTQDPAVVTPALKSALTHPGLRAALETGQAVDVIGMMPYVGADVLNGAAEEIIALGDVFSDQLPPQVLGASIAYIDALAEIESVTPEQRNAARTKLSGLFESAIAKMKAADDPMAERLEGSLAFMNGAFARGELMDNLAPALTVNWYSGEDTIASIADLKGKVVVLDFWATWCGPCIASFPNVKELQERYNGYDVAIVGITSLQGMHYPGDGPPVETEGNPEKEYELMKEFMKAKDMTWAVAFTEQEVFNPDFGVRGIPHVAILDTEGKVRFNGLHPAEPLVEKTEKIDKLLKEAGLPAPAPVGEGGG